MEWSRISLEYLVRGFFLVSLTCLVESSSLWSHRLGPHTPSYSSCSLALSDNVLIVLFVRWLDKPSSVPSFVILFWVWFSLVFVGLGRSPTPSVAILEAGKVACWQSKCDDFGDVFRSRVDNANSHLFDAASSWNGLRPFWIPWTWWWHPRRYAWEVVSLFHLFSGFVSFELKRFQMF